MGIEEKNIFEKEHDEPLVMALKSDDPELRGAKKNAIDSLEVFLEQYELHKENVGVFFAIKVPIQDGSSTSYFWFTFDGERDGNLVGQHFELPSELKKFQTISVPKDGIEDWMINDHGHLYGGWSIRIQRSKLPESERESFDKYAGIKVYKKNDF